MARKTAVTTGCSSGIGYALAVELAKRDIQVFATARNEESLRELEELHANITALPLDVCSSKSIQCLHDKVETLAPGGELAYLVNNAGAHYAAPGLELDRERVRMLFETNVFGVMQLCSTLADMLIAGRGTIVQIGSVTRNVPVIWQSAYNASKAALSQYSSTLRLELEPFGVTVCEVVTGYVQSNILRDGLHCRADSLYEPIKDHVAKMKNDGNRSGMPSTEYARLVAGQVVDRKPPAELWLGARASVLHFIVTWLPRGLAHRIWWRIFKLGLLLRDPDTLTETTS